MHHILFDFCLFYFYNCIATLGFLMGRLGLFPQGKASCDSCYKQSQICSVCRGAAGYHGCLFLFSQLHFFPFLFEYGFACLAYCILGIVADDVCHQPKSHCCETWLTWELRGCHFPLYVFGILWRHALYFEFHNLSHPSEYCHALTVWISI